LAGQGNWTLLGTTGPFLTEFLIRRLPALAAARVTAADDLARSIGKPGRSVLRPSRKGLFARGRHALYLDPIRPLACCWRQRASLLYLFEDYVLDTARRELRRGDAVLQVEPQVFDLLAYLIATRERVVSKDDLLAAVWKGRIVSESTLSSSINAVRTAIGDNGEDQRLVRTLPRKGFRFVAPVREEQEGAMPAAGAVVVDPLPMAPAQHQDEPDSVNRPVGAPIRVASRRNLLSRSRTIILLSAGVGLLAVATTLLVPRWNASEPAPRPATAAAGQKFDASAVPIIDDEARRSLASYPNRPDFKALAITGEGFAVSEGEASGEAARQDALRRCHARTKRQCRLYAVGMNVVWSPEALPLPAARDIRLEPLNIPLVPDEIPVIDAPRRETIARLHMKAANHRALALTTRGTWTTNSRTTRAEATRLALERCGEYWQRPCLILAVDGLLTIQVPKSRQVARLFLPSTEDELTDDDRNRIGRIYQGAEWRALARGENSWHAVAAAASEQAAIETAMKSCAQSDRKCRLYAIGNFRVLGD
jgi:DNA-binding winged helix-turn-helix (wHTH) protein